MELHGWLTLENLTAANFRDAQVQVVAGRLNLLGTENRGTSLIGDTAEFRDDDGLEEQRNTLLADIRDDPEEPESTPQPGGVFPWLLSPEQHQLPADEDGRGEFHHGQ